MGLSAHEQQALDSIEDRLCGSDPDLASMLATFTQLAAGEDMPAREKIRTGWRRAARRPHRNRRHPSRGTTRQHPGRRRQRPPWPGAGMVLGLLIALALVAGVLAFTGGRSARACPLPGTACAGQVPAHSAWLAGASASK